MKTLVAYYSHGGNNRFLAGKLAKDLGGDIQEIRPRLGGFGFVLLSSLTHASFGNRKIKGLLDEYDTVILCGPIYMGQLISPLKDFMKKNRKKIRKLYFVTCCGGGEDSKDTQFGYNQVFEKARTLLQEKYVDGAAFPIDLVVPAEMKGNTEGIMKIKLDEGKFTGAIADKYAAFIRTIAHKEK